MDKIKFLETVTKDICINKNVEFILTHVDYLEQYIFSFKKLGIQSNLVITEYDLCVKPFAVLKAQIEHAIYILVEGMH